MLTESERDLVEIELLRVSVTSPRAVLMSGLSLDLAGKLPEGVPVAVLVKASVDICIADGHNKNPCALAHLLTTLLTGVAGIDVIVSRIKIPPPPPPDPFDAVVLDNFLPFFARPKMRSYFRAFNAQPIPVQSVMV